MWKETTTAASRPATSRRRASALTLLGLTLALASAACGSSGTTRASATSTTVAKAACQQVNVVLSNGPDPGADPVGYAEAQVQPLRHIHTQDTTVGKAISSLADAYSGFYSADGKGGQATSQLTAAENRINSLCPGLGAAV